jgi:dipeptidyl aminopeptidase/acylaminoacyl peptidase
MKPSISHQTRQKIFFWVVLGCLALATGYTGWAIWRANAGTDLVRLQVQGQGTPLPTVPPAELEAIQNQSHLVFLHQEGPHFGQVSLVGLNPKLPQRVQTALRCDRIYYAAGNGICLLYDTSGAAQNPLAPIPVWVTLFGSDFQPRHQFTVEGIPSRTRVSPDGKYAAFTVFVSGHSYMDANMSTATILLDTATGESLGNLEEFETWKDGQLFQAPEFNFWGVTFAQDSNRFYATLRRGYTTYLVQGNLAARRMTVLHENVECPSLSPDETRIAFKKRMADRWQLTVLDLATMQEIELAEKENIDDQVEWLDNNHILYQKNDYDHPNWVNVFVVPADGSGKPEVFVPNATSPVVVR